MRPYEVIGIVTSLTTVSERASDRTIDHVEGCTVSYTPKGYPKATWRTDLCFDHGDITPERLGQKIRLLVYFPKWCHNWGEAVALEVLE